MEGIPFRDWLYYLVDTPTGKSYFIDDGGTLQMDNKPTPIKRDPKGWQDNQVSFGRSSHYFGLNRSFVPPLEFVDDGAEIIRQLFYRGKGVEVPLAIVIQKYNSESGIYEDYYSGLLDLSNIDDIAGQGISVKIYEGGAAQMIRAYENKLITIPCDGSIPENIKFNDDGILFQDTLYYQFVGFTSAYPGITTMPIAFIDEDGDSIGIIHGNPIYEQPTGTDYPQRSSNYLFSSIAAIKLKIKGTITVKNTPGIPSAFGLYFATSLSLPIGVDGLSYSTPLVPVGSTVPDHIIVSQQTVFNFEVTLDLAANENVFLFFFNQFEANPIIIVSGSFQIAFNSRFRATRPWGITAWDAFKYIIKKINEDAATDNQTFHFDANSKFLKSKLNWVLTSGDALRASGDPSYKRFYNLDPDNNTIISYGPGLKTTLSDFFDGLNPVGNNALGNERIKGSQTIYESIDNDIDVVSTVSLVLRNMDGIAVEVGMFLLWNGVSYEIISSTYDGAFRRFTLQVMGPDLVTGFFFGALFSIYQKASGNEAIFFERKGYVFDSSVNTMSLGEVSNLHISVALDHIFSLLNIGYEPKDYDQKQGKFEYNTTAKWQLPIKSVDKTLSLISKYRTDSYGAERLRFPSKGNSTTENSSDDSVFLFNIDRNSFIYDFAQAKFISLIADRANANNTNIRLTNNVSGQQVSMPDQTGSYLQQDNQSTIFVFNQVGFGASKTIKPTFNGTLSGNPGDKLTIKMFLNGVVLKTWIFTMPGDAVFAEAAYTLGMALAYKDAIWFTAEVSPTATATIPAFELDVQTYFTAQQAGIITIAGNTKNQLISLPNVTSVAAPLVGGTDVVSFGFEHFFFNEILINQNFDLLFKVAGSLVGIGQQVNFDLYINGVIVGSYSFTGTSGSQTFDGSISLNRDFEIGDIIFILASTTATAAAQITSASMDLTSTMIRAYNLLRKAYDAISGIPNPDSAYNIEEFTPKRMLLNYGNYIRAGIFNQIPEVIKFLDLSKNQYLSTTLNGKTITENANVAITDLEAPLFYPLILSFKTVVPINFNKLLRYAANGHIEAEYNGKYLYGFPITVSQKASLNESQDWKLLVSTKTDLEDLIDLDIDGLSFVNLQFYQMFFPKTSPLQWVQIQDIDPDFQTATIDQDWFVNRIKTWSEKSNYFQPWINRDTISLQAQTNGLAPLKIEVYTCKGKKIDTVVMNTPSNPAVQAPNTLYQVDIPLSGYGQQILYFLAIAGTGSNVSMAISEGIDLRVSWPKTILTRYRHKTNKFATIFNGGYFPCIRVPGIIHDMTGKSRVADYEDEIADIDILDAVAFETYKLQLGTSTQGVPDWLYRKYNRIMIMSETILGGTQYTRETGATWDKQSFPGQPRLYPTLEIREAKNRDAVAFDLVDGSPVNSSVLVSVELSSFGPNLNNDNGTDESTVEEIDLEP